MAYVEKAIELGISTTMRDLGTSKADVKKADKSR